MIQVQSRLITSTLRLKQKRALRQNVVSCYPKLKHISNGNRAFTVATFATTHSSRSINNLVTKRSLSTSAKNRGPISWAMFGLVGVAAAAAVSYYSIERERRMEEALGKIVTIGKPAIGAPWSLIDLNGKLVTEQDFAGKWTLLYFGFAHCPDICPSEMAKIAKVMDTIKKENPQLANQIQPIFVSVDPARDTIRALKEYAQDFHPSYVFLTGTPQQVQQMAKKYRVYVSKADETEDGDYLVDHSIVVYFHDKQGELHDLFTQSMKPSDIVEKVTYHMTNTDLKQT